MDKVLPEGGLRRVRPRIALIMRGLGYAYQDSILAGVHEVCQKLEYDALCLIGGVLSEPDPRSSVYSIVGADDVDGVIVATGSMGGMEHSPAFQELFARFSGKPICSIAYAQAGVPSVCIDNASGVYAATRHLIERHGKRRLAFLTGVGEESQQRFEGFERAHLDCKLKFDQSRLIQGNYGAETGVAAVDHLGDPSQPLVDAIVAANDWMAMGVLEEAERRGFSIPDQLAIVGFDDSDQARFTTPPLTTVRQPIFELGRAGVHVVAAQIAGQPVPAIKRLDTELVLRHSCGCRNRAILPESVPIESNDSVIGMLTRRRESCKRALTDGAPAASSSLGPGWSDELLEAMIQDLQTHQGQFVAALDRMLKYTANFGSVTSWHGALSSLRGATIRAGLIDLRQWFSFESIIEEGHMLIGSHAERVQGRRRIAKEVQAQAMDALGNTARTALDYTALGRGLSQHMGTIGLEHCWVTRMPASIHPAARSLLVVASDAWGADDVANEPEFPTGHILPTSRWLTQRSTYVILPMVFGGETLGLCIMPHGCPDAAIYQQISAPITAAVKAAILLETVVLEVTRREAAERERLEHEMAIAQRIQTAIFPKDFNVIGLELSASMDPATEVGGDYFDVLPTGDGCWLGIGDVAGHGLPTGLVALMIQSIVASMAQHGSETTPADLWRDMNSVLYDNVRTRLGQDEHATLTLIRYWSNGHLQFAGAHEDVVLLRRRADHCECVATPGVWAGITKLLGPDALAQQELQLEPGDLMLLYSDGITEAMNAERQLLGLARLCELLEQNRPYPVDIIRQNILREVAAWSHTQHDDRTLVIARYVGVG